MPEMSGLGVRLPKRAGSHVGHLRECPERLSHRPTQVLLQMLWERHLSDLQGHGKGLLRVRNPESSLGP